MATSAERQLARLVVNRKSARTPQNLGISVESRLQLTHASGSDYAEQNDAEPSDETLATPYTA